MSSSNPDPIDAIIAKHAGWKGDMITRLRAVITTADASITEEVKWRMASRPEGLPVWVSNGIVCFIEIWKDNVKLLFFKGAQLHDTGNLFNARLNSATLRAIELHEGDTINEDGIANLVRQAVTLNA